MVGRRCSLGCETWPDKPKFSICPRCDGATRRYKSMTPLSEKEAESIIKHIEFERYYATEHVADNEPFTDAELALLGLN